MRFSSSPKASIGPGRRFSVRRRCLPEPGGWWRLSPSILSFEGVRHRCDREKGPFRRTLNKSRVKERPEYLPQCVGWLSQALAVAAVVLYHAGVRGFSGGFVGVDVFFVISGFLISRLVVREVEAGTFSLGGASTNAGVRGVESCRPPLCITGRLHSRVVSVFFHRRAERAFGKDLESTMVCYIS